MELAEQACDFHEVNGRRIAFRHVAGTGPTIVFLPGYMSDMDGSKATAIYDWAASEGRACLLLDYSGCGRSEGTFGEGTLTRWKDEVLALIEAQVEGPVLLVGSSMGGWLMLLIGMALGERLHAMIGIAAAPDFTSWGYDREQKAALAAGQTVFEDNPYGPMPTPTHPGFWQDAQLQRMLIREVPLTCPVRLLHGQEDDEVPSDISVLLMRALASDDVQGVLVKGGDHRLSRPQDIALLQRTLESLL
ncbi:alpha/beta fold hydrolase [Aurantiacibacter flavus]|uniref:Palmitoyl-protein thioesterase ABHD10, mitochondrial n=1 Tax=Aurantiacibacter flavus TaxID=3145232 RepID=A0ABV0D1D1_9SPHN